MRQKETLTSRVDRLEDMARILFAAQIKTEETFIELRKEANEREKRADERIEKLVSAIGELIKARNGGVK